MGNLTAFIFFHGDVNKSHSLIHLGVGFCFGFLEYVGGGWVSWVFSTAGLGNRCKKVLFIL